MNLNFAEALLTAILACMTVDLTTAYRQQGFARNETGRLIKTLHSRKVKVDYGGRVVNGVRASIATFPFVVSIQRKQFAWQHYCGGSIFKPTIILTACHCVVRGQQINGDQWKLAETANMRVVAGVTDWTKPAPGRQIAEVRKLVAHPKCSNFASPNAVYNYDVGVVILQDPLFFTVTVQPMKIASSDVNVALAKLKDVVLSGMQCFTPGWGFIVESTRTVTRELMMATVQIMKSQQCRERFCHLANSHCLTDFYSIHQMCVVSADSSDCYGDSGGPLVCNGFVYGTVSYGYHCNPGWPTVFQNTRPILEILHMVTGSQELEFAAAPYEDANYYQFQAAASGPGKIRMSQ